MSSKEVRKTGTSLGAGVGVRVAVCVGAVVSVGWAVAVAGKAFVTAAVGTSGAAGVAAWLHDTSMMTLMAIARIVFFVDMVSSLG